MLSLAPLRKIQQTVMLKLGLTRLEKRERLVVLGGGAFVLLFVLVQFVFFPLLEKRTLMNKALVRKEAQLQQIRQLQAEYRNYQKSAGDLEERLSERSSAFSLFSFIEKQAAHAKVKKRIKYMKPSTGEDEGNLLVSQVEMSLKKITLKELVEFLSLVESDKNAVVVRRISIQEDGKEAGYLNTVLQIVTYTMNKSA